MDRQPRLGRKNLVPSLGGVAAKSKKTIPPHQGPSASAGDGEGLSGYMHYYNLLKINLNQTPGHWLSGATKVVGGRPAANPGITGGRNELTTGVNAPQNRRPALLTAPPGPFRAPSLARCGSRPDVGPKPPLVKKRLPTGRRQRNLSGQPDPRNRAASFIPTRSA